MTDPSGDKDRPTEAYEPPPTADPAPYQPENYDPPATDATAAAADTTAATSDHSSTSHTGGTPDNTVATFAAPDPSSTPGTPAAFAAPDPTATPGGTPGVPGHLPPGAFETPAAYIPGTPYAAPGQPQPMYPQPAYQQQYPYGPPAPYAQPPYGAVPARQDNALAIGALVCSILGFCSGITAIAGLVMGHIALSKTNRGEAGGRGLATAAVIVGYVVVALWVGFFTTLIILGANGELS